jgi:hypothetical protein
MVVAVAAARGGRRLAALDPFPTGRKWHVFGIRVGTKTILAKVERRTLTSQLKISLLIST